MLFTVFLASIFALSHQSVWDNLNANIAVVEYQPTQISDVPELAFMTNILGYIGVFELLQDEELDMIIFPELTLGNNRDIAVDVVLNTGTDDATNSLIVFSLLAANRNTYLVINVVEREKCAANDAAKNCKDLGFRYYNTDVVFDRSGTVINKYRKYNLFGENEKDQPETAEAVVIETDFGVKFGIFTCFDILFKSPAQDVLEKHVDGIIFPTMWYSELPFLTAVQTQQMYAHAHDIAFFGAGANMPSEGSGGTGVYRGAQGAVLSGIVAEGGTKTFVYKSVNGEYESQEPEDVDVLAKQMDDFKLKRDKSVDDSNSIVLDPSITEYSLSFKNGTENDLQCNFTFTMVQNALKPGTKYYYTYHLVAFSGVRSFDGVYNGGIEVCGVLACLNNSLSSCGYRFPTYDEVDFPIDFEEITITANFVKHENRTQFPNSLLSSILPINPNETEWSSEEVEENGKTYVQRTWALKEKQNKLMTFAIYGRIFDQDFPPDSGDDDNNDGKTPSAANRTFAAGFWLPLVVVYYCLKL